MRSKLKDNIPEDIDRLYQDAINDFMQGKYQIAENNLKQLRLMLKNISN